MIRLLTLILESITVRANTQSWQDHNGTFHPLKLGATHGDFAADQDDSGDDLSGIEKLWKRGWNRITYMGTTLLAHNEYSPPNRLQLRALIDLAKEAGFTHLEWDGGEDSKILWSEFDQL